MTMPETPPLSFNLAAPEVHADRCLNARHRQAGCSLCMQHCPVNAIELMAGARPLPLLDAETCVGCGVCLRVCPTDAFAQKLHPETKLTAMRGELPADENLTLVCPQHPTPGHSAAPGRYAILHQRCLAAFSPQQLLALSLEGQRQVWLSDEVCQQCPLGALHQDIVETAEAANQMLTSFGHPQAIHLLSETHAAPHPMHILDGAAPAVSRRGFFRSLGKLAQQRVDEAAAHAAAPLFAPGAPVDQRLPYHTPASLQRLNQSLAQLAAAGEPTPDAHLDAAALPWATVQVEAASCSGCQLCARFCPTGALNYLWGEVDGHTIFNLTFHPALCLDCGICTAVCPENAIHITHGAPAQALLASEPALLHAGYLEPCQRCGALTARRPGDNQALCFVCRAPTMHRQNTQRAYLDSLAQQLVASLPASQKGGDE